MPKIFLCLSLLTSIVIANSLIAAEVPKVSISLKPSYLGERISVQPANADQNLDALTTKAIIKLISDKKFIPESQEIASTISDSDISFGYNFSYYSKAKVQFDNCFVLWYESLDNITALKVAQFLFATDEMSESDWKAYGSLIGGQLKSAAEDGHKICVERKPKSQTYDMFFRLDRYFEKSSSLTAEETQRISLLVEPSFSVMRSDVTQFYYASILAHIKKWVENIRSSSIEPTRILDFNELWGGKKLTKAELSGRALFRLLPKERIDSVAASKDVSSIYGVLLSVDNLLNACSLDETATTPLCAANQMFQWLEIKTSNGNTQLILAK